MATKRLSSGAGAVKKEDPRQLMRQTALQSKMTGSKRVSHPLARYNKLDQLSCAVCLTLVKSEAAWNAHLLSKSHKQCVEKLKRGEPTVPVKTSGTTSISKPIHQPEKMEFEEKSSESSDVTEEEPPTKQAKSDPAMSDLPADFFDSGPPASNSTSTLTKNVNDQATPPHEEAATEQVPEGFFDDAKRDAKARKVKFVDKFEDVWQDFQKEITKETQVSRAIVDEEDDRLFIERDVAEIDDDIERWARVEALHNKREAQKSAAIEMDTTTSPTPKPKSESDDSDEEFSIDLLDWRQKKF